MGWHVTTALTAAMIVAALGFSGCTTEEHSKAPRSERSPVSAPLTSTAVAQAPPLPPPDALTTVLYQLADPAVPGSQKLNLVQGATPDNAGVLDQFSNALLNGGFAPMKFEVRDLAWSDRDPADVVAYVNVSSPNPGGPRFSYPMEFTPYRGGWQLSARTAQALLAYGSAQAPPPAPTPGH